MFAVTKIQIFESNSQRNGWLIFNRCRCSPSQRYKFLKAIHNCTLKKVLPFRDVRRHKDTNFWKQFTTFPYFHVSFIMMFAVTKIQIFESNSQHLCNSAFPRVRCSPSQRYKFLKAIHNLWIVYSRRKADVRRHKDTNFWKQFTTFNNYVATQYAMFAVTKIQIFESNSQR